MVQDYRNGWWARYYGGQDAELHRVDNLCKKNMLVYRAPSTGRSCSSAAGAAAQTLLNTVTNTWDNSHDVVEAVYNGEGGYGLDSYLILSWDNVRGGTEWARV